MVVLCDDLNLLTVTIYMCVRARAAMILYGWMCCIWMIIYVPMMPMIAYDNSVLYGGEKSRHEMRYFI
jgi:hypothetical protein